MIALSLLISAAILLIVYKYLFSNKSKKKFSQEPLIIEGSDSDEYVKLIQPTRMEPKLLEDSDVILGLKKESVAPAPAVKEAPPKKLSLVVFYLVAPQGEPYRGYELLQALLAVGLRFGRMNIFHRHEEKTSQGNILFSLASAVEPGTFDLAEMGGYSCPGLTLFLDPNKLTKPIAAFDLMWQTVNHLLDDLGGQLLDDQKTPLTEQKILAIRQQLQKSSSSLSTVVV